MHSTSTDVLIVGAGPTGLTVAVSLMARGRQVTVVDGQAEGQNTSRASAVYPRTLEVLDPYGVAEQLAAEGIHARRFTIRDHDRVLMTVPFDRLPTAYPYTLLVLQAVTEAVLLQRLHQLGGTVAQPCTLTSLGQDGVGVTATFADGQQVHAGYLVGADGMHSTVRDQAGIGFSASTSGLSYSLADVRLSGGVPAGEVASERVMSGKALTRKLTVTSTGCRLHQILPSVHWSSSAISKVAPPVARLARSAMVELPSSEAIPTRNSSTLS